MSIDKFDPAFWPQEDAGLDDDMSEEEMDAFLLVDDEYEAKERPICPKCERPYVCTHDKCDMCLICERRVENANHN